MLQYITFQDVVDMNASLELSGIETATIEECVFSANSYIATQHII